MDYKKLIEEKLKEAFAEHNRSLASLKEELSRIGSMVPEDPDISRLSEAIAEAIPEPAPAKEDAPAVASAPAMNNKLLYYLGKMEYSSNQSDILKDLMEYILEYSERALLCIVKEDTAKVWNQSGFDDFPQQAANITISKDPLLKSLIANRSRLILDDSAPAFLPTRDSVKRCMISPLLLKGKVAAFIYADSKADGKLDHYSIDILIKSASLVLDLMPLRPKRDPLPPTLEEVPITGSGSEPAVLASPQEELFVESGEMAVEESPLERTSPAKPPEFDSFPPPSPPMETGGVYEPEEAVEDSTPEVPQEIQAEEPPPPPPKPVEEEEPVPPEEQKEHEGAKRFARLLVQEIALYHPDEVDRGKKDKNVMSLLRDDIEKSRDAYEQRYQKPSIKKRDYFTKALVQYLGGGDPSSLGS